MKILTVLLPIVPITMAACGTTLYADHYSSDCDANNQCVRVSVGDQCACTCDLAAISERDYDKYIADLERIGGCRNTCGSSDIDAGPDAAYTCGEGMSAQCNAAGKCVIVAVSP